jgi:hypothetical protein
MYCHKRSPNRLPRPDTSLSKLVRRLHLRICSRNTYSRSPDWCGFSHIASCFFDDSSAMLIDKTKSRTFRIWIFTPCCVAWHDPLGVLLWWIAARRSHKNSFSSQCGFSDAHWGFPFPWTYCRKSCTHRAWSPDACECESEASISVSSWSSRSCTGRASHPGDLTDEFSDDLLQ